MSLVVNLQSGPIDFDMDGYTRVNVYHIDRHYDGVAKDFLNELIVRSEKSICCSIT